MKRFFNSTKHAAMLQTFHQWNVKYLENTLPVFWTLIFFKCAHKLFAERHRCLTHTHTKLECTMTEVLQCISLPLLVLYLHNKSRILLYKIFQN
jgi:hypothetical protein